MISISLVMLTTLGSAGLIIPAPGLGVASAPVLRIVRLVQVHYFSFLGLGNVTGNPGVFRGNPCPFPQKPAPAGTGAGFYGNGSRVLYNPRELNPVRAYDGGFIISTSVSHKDYSK